MNAYSPAWKKFGNSKSEPKEDNKLEMPEDGEEPTDGEEPLKDGKTTIHIEHEDGSKSKHEFDNLKELHSKINDFLKEEENEWKKEPEDEEESHKGSMGDEDGEEESNPFTDVIKGMK